VVDYQKVIVDHGEEDKRLLIFESEFATVLRRMRGETNSLSAVVREAWDSGNLSTLTKNSPLRATGAHVSIIAHSTRAELLTSLTETDRANGFANRFIFVLVKRSKVIPEPVSVPEQTLTTLMAKLFNTVGGGAWKPRQLRRDPEATALWAEIYPSLSAGKPGLLGAILARAEAHVLRLSLIYAALDKSDVVRREHLQAALAVWKYAEASAEAIFGKRRLGLPLADTILTALRQHGSMSRTAISELFSRNVSAADLDAALTTLHDQGLIERSFVAPEGGLGRSVEIWQATA
jgi:hypothetical protein